MAIFAASAGRWPGHTALEAPDATYTYAELAAAAAALAERLGVRGIGRGDRVAVRVDSGSAELYLAILGVLFCGAAYVPIDADDPPERAQDVCRRSGARALIGDGLTIEPLLPLRHPSRARRHVAIAAPPAPTPQDDAWIIFTSGSTGAPKGVAVTHGSAAAFIDAEAELWSVSPEDRVLAGLSVGFDASCEEMWLAWANGAALVPAPRAVVRAGVELGDWLVERGISVLSTVPTLAALWDESCLHGVRLMILGGEACPEPLGWRLAAGREVWNTYGPTEATVVSTAAPVVPGESITIGWPLQGWDVAVVEGDHEVAFGEPGELVIGGVGLGRYIDPELDAERYAPLPALGWERAYRTGDLVCATPDGLQYLGRRDDQVKIGGRRIELGEIEAALQSAPGVQAAAAAVRESAAGNQLLVGYVVGGESSEQIRSHAARRLPAGVVPQIVALAELPMTGSGKVDRRALPWPVVADQSHDPAAAVASGGVGLTEHESWLAQQWVDQLGAVAIGPESDFFALGGTSLAAAKLISVLRRRHPAVAVADLYRNPTLRSLAARLEGTAVSEERDVPAPARARTLARCLQLACLLAAVFIVEAPSWLAGMLAFDRIYGVGPQLGWGWIIGGWLLLASVPSRALLAIAVRRLLMRGVKPGRYARNGWLCFRVIFVERLADLCHLGGAAGTPWAHRYARLCGHRVGAGARLGTLPPASSIVQIGAGATIEGDVDMHGWWVEGEEFVIAAVTIGDGARIGMRTLLMPGAVVETGAEVEPGSVVTGRVPANERWCGSPAVRVGRAGEDWPQQAAAAPTDTRRRVWHALYVVGSLYQTTVPLLAALPELGLILLTAHGKQSSTWMVLQLLILAPAFAVLFTVCFALLVAASVRAVAPLIRPGWHEGPGATPWALWMTDCLMELSRNFLFPVYASSFTNRWLRLCGVPVGRRTEISTAAGLSKLTSFGQTCFVADDVVLACGRARAGWLHVAPIRVGDRSFFGNGAMLGPGTAVGSDTLIGLLTTAPRDSPDRTSWLGMPALEIPRRPQAVDPRRTTNPPRRLRVARRAMDTIRILFPSSVAVVLGAGAYGGLEATGSHFGIAVMAAAIPATLLVMGAAAVTITVLVKWLLMGRYRAGDRPFYSHYVWRDEIVNTCQEQLAGALLLNFAVGTVLIPLYLRLMGSRVGRDAWIENLNTTEFDLASFGDGCAINRASVLETHLIHDRVMSTGPATVGRRATLGPLSLTLPDTVIADGTVVGGRSIVMRGEELPPGTRWHGAPVVAEGRERAGGGAGL